jgi:rare lipoprotein A
MNALSRLGLVAAALLAAGCSLVDESGVSAFEVAQRQLGIASVYTDTRTASGERFSSHSLCAAHRTWPMGSLVRVTNLRNGRTALVRINDRGPFREGRVIDLTPAAASAIGLSKAQGLTKVRLELLHAVSYHEARHF